MTGMQDFLGDLSGGLEGAGMGATILGGMKTAGIATNPWVAGGVLAAGAGVGLLNSMDPSKRRATKLNERLGRQEADMNDLSIQDTKTKMGIEAQKRKSWDQFGGLFSRYMSGMAMARPTGQAAFNQDLGVG